MIWVLMCLAVIAIAWFMYVPRFGRNETLIPVDDNSLRAGSAPERAAAGDAALTEEVHPAHVYETGAHATGAYPNGHLPEGPPGFDAYVASTDPVGDAGGAADGLARD